LGNGQSGRLPAGRFAAVENQTENTGGMNN
jgi:hypothetical protein